jgi:hypothetical protein
MTAPGKPDFEQQTSERPGGDGDLSRRPQDPAARLRRATREALRPPAPEPMVAANGVCRLPLPLWDGCGGESLDWLMGGFSTRRGGLSRVYAAAGSESEGELNLGFTASDTAENVTANRRLLAQAVSGSSDMPLITLRQIHSSLIVRAGRDDLRRDLPCEGDGLMTAEPGLLLGIQTADCIPVLIADRKERVVAAFHAGWRGTVARIVEHGVSRMRAEYGSQPRNLIAAIGPGIGACCYSVGEEVLEAFTARFRYAQELFRAVSDADPLGDPESLADSDPRMVLDPHAPGQATDGLHLNLVEANRRQLLDAGLGEKAIRSVGGCTCCRQELFFSHRGSRGFTGRMMSVIGIRSEASRK